MKVKIKKWSAVATWHWDIPDDDVCGICQIHFDGSCPSCRFPGDDCALFCPVELCSLLISWLRADRFQHCITQWIRQESSRGQCPMCRQNIEVALHIPTIGPKHGLYRNEACGPRAN
ncbi:hypothetical protein VPNG_04357 [Cytospora leucostoma]|uniref:Anaphase-promoting complex subunit 11 RING-H2 finger domain-containing protein n=1 Tax=Cytospora leucostoma TaxID=1230097 RepID=A0A423XBV6_9PEZI|nr:hypothetical protein VPNG_04357 [Cytospora leucostoma]